MTQITSLYVHKVLSQLAGGVETRDLLAALDMASERAVDPTLMIAADAFYDFFARVAERDPNGATLPLRIGATMKSDEYGAFGLAWKSAPDLRGSFTRAARYGHVLGNAETYTLEPSEDGWLFALDKAGDTGPGMLLSNEASMSAVMTICQEVAAQPFQQSGVFFTHSPRADRAIYERHFNCPVHFNSTRNALLVSEASLDVPNTLGDETIARFFDQHLEAQLAQNAAPETLDKRVRLAITKMLSEGVPTLSAVAESLGMSARTLQRRLSEQEKSFQNLVDQARRELSQQLLNETDYSLAEIAFLTGFAEQSGFTRAFKRWSGQTPRSYRLALQTGH